MSLILYFFYGALILASLRLASHLVLAIIYNLKRGSSATPEKLPRVSIIIPAFNEENVIGPCVESLRKITYSNFEAIIVDDGSTDRTYKTAKSFESEDIRVIRQTNQGKAKALDTGIGYSTGEIIVTVDSDTFLQPNSIEQVVSRIERDKKVLAVAGNIKVKPSPGLLNTLQAAEYTIGINLVRKAQSIFRSVMIVPGPLATFKRQVLSEVEGFSDDTYAEDFDITMKVLKVGGKVDYEDHAIAVTDAPRNLEDLIKQRRRWYRGTMQVLAKHEDMYLRKKYGVAGLIGVPYMWFDLVAPFINFSLILLIVLMGLTTGAWTLSFAGIVLFWSLDTIVYLVAQILDPVRDLRAMLISPLMLFYDTFMDGIRIGAFAEELVSVTMKWEKPRRV